MGDHDDTWTRLDAALRADDPWIALYALNAESPQLPGLAEAAEDLYRTGAGQAGFRRYLTGLLQMLGEQGDAVLLRLLAEPDLPADDRLDVLRTAVVRGLRVPAELLRGYAVQGVLDPVLIDARGLSGDPSFAPGLGALLDDPAAPRGRAALALGRLGAREWTAPIAQRLSEVTGLEHAAFTVALELMGDPAAVPHLLRWLAESGEERVYDVHHALVRLTGRDPLLPAGETGAAYAAAVRAVWAGKGSPRPVVRDLVVESATRARFSVDGGAGRIRVDFDPPTPGSSWPRWNRSLTVGGKPLYRVGSVCDTCELGLTLLDWPDAEAARFAARMRLRLADPERLDADWFDEWAPVLGELETGHYRALLLDLPLERVTEPARSWWFRRLADRVEEDDDPGYVGERPEDHWPGVEHFQLTAPVPGGRVPATYGAVLPSRPPGTLDPATVARHAAAIAAGERPAALVLGWIDDRYVQARDEERWLVGTVLDGHHRLAAYADAGVPARVLLLARPGEGGAEGGAEGLDEVGAAYQPAPGSSPRG